MTVEINIVNTDKAKRVSVFYDELDRSTGNRKTSIVCELGPGEGRIFPCYLLRDIIIKEIEPVGV